MCKQFIQINTLERTIKDQSLAINEHEAELESLHKKNERVRNSSRKPRTAYENVLISF
jgi:hypothetical protein